MTYRSITDIISQIIESANGGNAMKIKIMHNAFLDYSELTKYSRVLTEGDSLKIDQLTQTSKTAEKGLRFLKTYNHLDYMVKV